MSYRRTTRHLRRKVIEAARALVELGDAATIGSGEVREAWRELARWSRALNGLRKARKRRPS